MTIKPVADLYLIKYEDGRLYKCTRDAEEAIDAIGFGFEVEEFVSLDNHRDAMLQGAEPVSNCDELTDAVNCLLDVMDEYPESLVPINRNSAVIRQLRSIIHQGENGNYPDGWVACSERMPEPKRWLALYGARVFTHGDERGQPYHKSCVDQGYLGSDGQFYLLNWDQPGTLDDNYNNDLAIATHWMYFELPSAPRK